MSDLYPPAKARGKATLEQQIMDCGIAKSDAEWWAMSEIEKLRAEVAKYAKALGEIRDHWACQYDHPYKENPMYAGSYGIGVTDGHRAAALIAGKALSK